METIFVANAIKAAAKVVKDEGIKKAMEIFNEKGSPFRTHNSYIWIYDTNGVCLYNPEYPEII